MSDLHLETIPFPEAFHPTRPDFEVMVVAGDVWEGDCARGFRFLRKLAGDKPVIMVMGNHEHWNGVLSEDLEMSKIVAKDHSIHLLDGDTVTVEGCVFVGATLWADYTLGRAEPDPAAETGEQIEIEHDGGTHLITVGDTVVLHNAARERLERLVGGSDASLPLVVVSHHAPLPDCLTPAMKDTWAAGNSASDLSSFFETDRIALWIHGHLHHSVDIRKGSDARIRCTPAGPMFSNALFDDGLVVEV